MQKWMGLPSREGRTLQTMQPPACMQHVFSDLKPSAPFPSVGCVFPGPMPVTCPGGSNCLPLSRMQ